MEISLAGVNVHCGLTRHGTPYSVSDAIGALDADVVLIQENWRPRCGQSVARQAAEAHGYRSVAELDLVDGVTLAGLQIVRGRATVSRSRRRIMSGDETGAWGLAVLSRLPWLEQSAFPLGLAPGDLGGGRFAQVVEIPAGPGERLRVVNTHLTYKLPYGPGQLRRMVARLAAQPTPTVIGGDLNMCRPTIGLSAPFRPAVRGRTWPAHRPIAQIDHLLTGPRVNVLHAAVSTDFGSDHRAVSARVAVTSPARTRQPEAVAHR